MINVWRNLLPSIVASAAALVLAASAAAIQPDAWIHTTEADFEAGENENTIVTNLGDVTIATGSEVVGEMPEQVTILYDLQLLDDSIYIAAGPEAKLLRKSGDTIEEVLALDGEQIFALDLLEGQLLVAVSGATSRLDVLEADGQLRTLVVLEGVRYVWDVHVNQTRIDVATGIEGRLLRVNLDAQKQATTTELLDAEQVNLLCLGADSQGRVYAGSDTDGLVYRITTDDNGEPQTFVLYDAAEPEIGAMLVMADGTVYAGTADAEQARPGRLEEAAAEEAGRPKAKQAAEPAPGKLPQMAPAEPVDTEAPSAESENDKKDKTEEPAAAPAQEAATPADESPGKPIQPPDPPDSPDPAGAAAPESGGPTDFQAGSPQAPTPEQEEAAEEQRPPAPTPEQYDRLRQLIRQRLLEARDKPVLQLGGPPRPTSGRAAPSRARPVKPAAADKKGNAIYRIDPDGFVTEVFRESVMVLRMIESDGRIRVATGNEGQVFSVDPLVEETATLLDLQSEQLPAMIQTADGAVLLGTANPAQLVLLDRKFAARGIYTSSVMDAAQISLWGTLNLTAHIPERSSVTVETRSGNVKDPEKAAWSAWSSAQAFMPDPQKSALEPRPMTVQSLPARFVQYRLTLTGGPQISPVVDRVELTYVTPNIRPKIASIKATYPEARGGKKGKDKGPATTMKIEWEATDPNEDQLVFKLEYQPAGSARFLPLAEDLEETSYEWQTRRVPDGRYLIRLTADDRRANPTDSAMTNSRLSDPVLVDNTPPKLEQLEQAVEDQSLIIRGVAADALSQIRSIAYAVDQIDEYQQLLAEDLIFDSTRETWRVKIAGLDPGQHAVTIRLTDARGNAAYQAVLVEIESHSPGLGQR